MLLCSACFLFSFKPGTQNWLLILHSDSATISDGTLQLGGEGGMVAAFQNEGGREAKAISTKQLISNWGTLFHNAPPNAVVVFKEHSNQFTEHLVVLNPPAVISGKLTFEIVELGTPLNGSYGESLLFIDANIPNQEPSLSLFNAEVPAVQTPNY